MDDSFTIGGDEYIDGTIIGYLTPFDKDSKGEPAFRCSRTEQPAYLFQVQFDNGIKDDLEEFDLKEKCTWLNDHIDNSCSDVDTDNDDNYNNTDNNGSDSDDDSDFDNDYNHPGTRGHMSSKAKTKSTAPTSKSNAKVRKNINISNTGNGNVSNNSTTTSKVRVRAPHDKEIQLYALQLFEEHPYMSGNDVLQLLKSKFKEYKRIQYLNRNTVQRWRNNKKNIKNSSSIN
jgi:hypothetical protein